MDLRSLDTNELERALAKLHAYADEVGTPDVHSEDLILAELARR